MSTKTRRTMVRKSLTYQFKVRRDFPKDNVLAVKPGGHDGANEKLGSVGIGTSVGCFEGRDGRGKLPYTEAGQ